MKYIAVFMLAIVLSACTTVGNQKLSDVNVFMTLKEGKSTKVNIYDSFGQPSDVRAIDSETNLWVYYLVHTRTSAWTFVPFVGMAAGGSQKTMTVAYFRFDKDGVMDKMERTSEQGYENMWAGMGRGLSNFSDHTPAERVSAEMQTIGKPFDPKLAKRTSAISDKR